ncbi:MAG TPA: hypothetical protein VLH19_04485 [Patescibacteria group bacterium]|nr:hypothetical protein [Patescibacteria group bacterium]
MLIAQAPGIFGNVEAPPGVKNFASTAAGNGSGLIVFASNLIKLVTIIAGLVALVNIITAGYTLLTSSGNPKATEQATQQLVYSGIGIAVIVVSFTIISIISFLLFGDATFILNPVIPTPV